MIAYGQGEDGCALRQATYLETSAGQELVQSWMCWSSGQCRYIYLPGPFRPHRGTFTTRHKCSKLNRKSSLKSHRTLSYLCLRFRCAIDGWMTQLKHDDTDANRLVLVFDLHQPTQRSLKPLSWRGISVTKACVEVKASVGDYLQCWDYLLSAPDATDSLTAAFG
ncbi:unnamed protein product [Peronospora belbahrii]|uniref:Uncharacterized protein n=1 Tax=Peronospora belbahrii TaxID=622444 RepID=A0AAU9KQN2_9STRA|nr:unnamed protein product [Peronospora belbahrii]